VPSGGARPATALCCLRCICRARKEVLEHFGGQIRFFSSRFCHWRPQAKRRGDGAAQKPVPALSAGSGDPPCQLSEMRREIRFVMCRIHPRPRPESGQLAWRVGQSAEQARPSRRRQLKFAGRGGRCGFLRFGVWPIAPAIDCDCPPMTRTVGALICAAVGLLFAHVIAWHRGGSDGNEGGRRRRFGASEAGRQVECCRRLFRPDENQRPSY